MGFGNWLKNNWKDVATVGGTVIGAVQAGKSQGKANDLTDQALAQSKEQYNQRSPFRAMALQGINAANAPVDSGAMFRNDSNPFSRARDYSTDLGAGRVQNVDMSKFNEDGTTKTTAKPKATLMDVVNGVAKMPAGYNGPPIKEDPMGQQVDPNSAAGRFASKMWQEHHAQNQPFVPPKGTPIPQGMTADAGGGAGMMASVGGGDALGVSPEDMQRSMQAGGMRGRFPEKSAYPSPHPVDNGDPEAQQRQMLQQQFLSRYQRRA